MVEQQKHDVGDIKPIRMWIALRNKFTGFSVKIKFLVKIGELTEETNKFGNCKLSLNQYLQGQQSEGSKIQLDFIPAGWDDEVWGGDDPTSWGEEASEIPYEMYRPITVKIDVKNNEPQDAFVSVSGNLAILNPDPKSKPSEINENAWENALDSVEKLKKPNILLLLQPIWIKAQGFSNRPKSSKDPTLIVVHHTGGSLISSAIHQFTHKEARSSAHYIIDRDGQILKMVMNSKRAWHADGKDGSYWKRRKQVNGFSIGIEVVHSDEQGDFTDEQYEALINLIEKLRDKYDKIPAWGIVGHSDVQRPPTHQCPGRFFDWKKLEDKGLGLKLDPEYESNLKKDDFPIVKGKRISDEKLRKRINQLIEDLKADLREIGYFLPDEKGYGSETVTAINRFKRHFFAGSRIPKDEKWTKVTNGEEIDFKTAVMIKSVRSYIDKQNRRS